MSTLKKNLVIIISAGVVVIVLIIASVGLIRGNQSEGLSVANQDQWHEYNATTSSFEILFPGRPTETTQELPVSGGATPINQKIYQVEASDTIIYSATVITFPSGMTLAFQGNNIPISNPDAFLNAAVNLGPSTELPGSIVSLSPAYFQRGEATDFIITLKGEAAAKGRDILVGQNLYQLLVIYYGGPYNDSDYQKFINSFQLSP